MIERFDGLEEDALARFKLRQKVKQLEGEIERLRVALKATEDVIKALRAELKRAKQEATKKATTKPRRQKNVQS